MRYFLVSGRLENTQVFDFLTAPFVFRHLTTLGVQRNEIESTREELGASVVLTPMAIIFAFAY